MTAPESTDDLRAELKSLEDQIAELQGHVDEMRGDDIDPADRAAAIGQAEQQETLISQLDVRRRELMERLEDA
jgi:TolA-binding protein